MGEQITQMGYSQLALDQALNARIANVTVNDEEPMKEIKDVEKERMKELLTLREGDRNAAGRNRTLPQEGRTHLHDCHGESLGEPVEALAGRVRFWGCRVAAPGFFTRRVRALLHSLAAAVWLQPFAFPLHFAEGHSNSAASLLEHSGALPEGKRSSCPAYPILPPSLSFFSGVVRLLLQLFFCHFVLRVEFLVLPGQLQTGHDKFFIPFLKHKT